MCGIFGVINFNGQPVDKEKVLSARDVLAHRGPDDCGIYFSNAGKGDAGSNQSSVALAHRRLSIIDLSDAAHQPMTTEDACQPARQGRFTIVFNGEIYNYNDIRNQVSGIQDLRSSSDTEVIIKLFAIEGPECLNKLRGMFAFAIWDDKEKKLFAARDRFGIKPLYYLHNEKEFIFSSELKAIKHYKNGLTLSMEGMDAFLRTGSVPAPLTIYEETKALLPGHWLIINNDQLSINNYWSFFDLLNNNSTNPGEMKRRRIIQPPDYIRTSLLDSIKAHMVADVEVGAFLSGGIDSTAIVSLMRQAGQEKIKTISVTFPGHQLDESAFSTAAAKKYNTDHYEYRLQEDELINDFDKIIESMDQPTIDGINTYFISKAAASLGLKVVLSGVGGDELFGGYPSFVNIPKYQRIKSLPFAKPIMRAAGFLLNGKLPAKAIEYFNNPDAPNAEYRLLRGLFTDTELNNLGWHPASGIRYPASGIQYVSFLESTFYMRNQLLRDSDVFSMVHSLELRVPFVDHILYSAVLPYLNDGFDKSFSKRLLADAVGDLPDEIVHRPKQGFTFPFSDWMKRGKMKAAINDVLTSSEMKDYFNPQALLNLRGNFHKNKIHWSRVWALFIASRFSRQQV